MAAGVAGWWAAEATLRPPDVEVNAAAPAVYTVSEGMVGRTMTFAATALWETTPLAIGGSSGTVTSVDVTPGEIVEAGDQVYSVDERPVVVAAGEVPAYRVMSNGARGQDVAQLQSLLADLGYHAGEAHGRFDGATTRAVTAWQRAQGLTGDGIVAHGDVVFVPALPARVVPAEPIRVGGQVAPGDDALLALPDAPAFVVNLAREQRDLVPLTADVVVEHPGGEWSGRIASVETGEFDQIEFVLEGTDGGPICGGECAEAVPPDGEAHFRTQIVVTPDTTGPLVPAAALQVGAGGQTSVTTTGGETLQVTLMAADAGQAIVDGLDVGETIMLFGSDDPAGEPSED